MQNFRNSMLVLSTLLLYLCGCKPDAALKKGEVIDRGTYSSRSGIISPDAGAITGTVSFRGTPPARVAIDMSMDPACSMSAAQNDSEQYVVHNGKLANVYIMVRSGISPSDATGEPPVVMDQKGCRYVPHVIALQQGGSVEFRNSDPTMHNTHAVPITSGAQGIDISQAPGGAPVDHQFHMPEIMMPVRCNNHPWMNAFINVSQTPYFAVTGADGSFKLAGLPPGHYTIAAIHEKLGEQDIDVTVPARGVAKANFAFSMK